MNTTTRKFSSHPSKELHLLVQSMTKGQHLGFRQQLSPKRLALYELLRNMDAYDPKAVQAAFPEDSRNNLHATKVALLDQLTRYLYLAEAQDGIRDLQLLVGEAQKLHRMGRRELALARINSAIETALDLELGDVLIKAIEVRRDVATSLPGDVPDFLDYDTLVRIAMREAAIELSLDELLFEANLMRAQPIEVQYQLALNLRTRLDAISWPNYHRTQIKHHRLRFYCARVRMEDDNSMEAARSILSLIDGRPALLLDHELRQEYASKLNFLIVQLIDLQLYAEAKVLLGSFEQLVIEKNGGMEGAPNVHAHFLHASLWMRICMKDWYGCKALTDSVFLNVVQQGALDGQPMRQSILMLATYSAFLLREYGLARRFIREYRAHTRDHLVKGSSLIWIGIVFLLSYMEEEDGFLLRACKEISVWWKSVGCTGDYEKTMLDFCQQASDGETVRISPLSLVSLHASLTNFFSSSTGRPYAEIFPIFEWILSKQTGEDIRSYLGGGYYKSSKDAVPTEPS